MTDTAPGVQSRSAWAGATDPLPPRGTNVRRRLPDFIVDFSIRYNRARNTTGFNVSFEPAALFDRRKSRQADRFLDFERMAWYR